MKGLFGKNIFLNGKIEAVAFEKFVSDFGGIISTTEPEDEITLVINSAGGDTQIGLAIYDLIADSGRNFTGVVLGRADSMALVILQACKKRIMSRSSTIMAHPTKVVFNNVGIGEAEEMLGRCKRLEEIALSILADRSGNEDFRKLKSQCCYDAEQALSVGLVDEIYGE